MTTKESVLSVSSTRRETLVSNSFCKRSRRFREVTYVPSRPANGRGVDRKQHGDGGLIDGDGRQRRRIFDGGDGLADCDVFDAGDGDDVAQVLSR